MLRRTPARHCKGAVRVPTSAVVVFARSDRVTLDLGACQGIGPGQKWLIYGLGEEILDHSTGKSLGRLEIVRGTGVIVHVGTHASCAVSSKGHFRDPAAGDCARLIEDCRSRKPLRRSLCDPYR